MRTTHSLTLIQAILLEIVSDNIVCDSVFARGKENCSSIGDQIWSNLPPSPLHTLVFMCEVYGTVCVVLCVSYYQCLWMCNVCSYQHWYVVDDCTAAVTLHWTMHIHSNCECVCVCAYDHPSPLLADFVPLLPTSSPLSLLDWSHPLALLLLMLLKHRFPLSLHSEKRACYTNVCLCACQCVCVLVYHTHWKERSACPPFVYHRESFFIATPTKTQ